MFNNHGQCFLGYLINYGWCQLDTIQQINSYLLNKHYDGLMKSGKIEGSSLILWQNNQQ
jgi:hypothetical protein